MKNFTSTASARLTPFVFAARGAPHLLLRLEALAALVAAVLAYRALGGGWARFASMLLVPDLSMLAHLAGRRAGSVVYNAAHSLVGPALLVALGLAAAMPSCPYIGVPSASRCMPGTTPQRRFCSSRRNAACNW
jgi:hypothetical protein